MKVFVDPSNLIHKRVVVWTFDWMLVPTVCIQEAAGQA